MEFVAKFVIKFVRGKVIQFIRDKVVKILKLIKSVKVDRQIQHFKWDGGSFGYQFSAPNHIHVTTAFFCQMTRALVSASEATAFMRL